MPPRQNEATRRRLLCKHVHSFQTNGYTLLVYLYPSKYLRVVHVLTFGYVCVEKGDSKWYTRSNPAGAPTPVSAHDHISAEKLHEATMTAVAPSNTTSASGSASKTNTRPGAKGSIIHKDVLTGSKQLYDYWKDIAKTCSIG